MSLLESLVLQFLGWGFLIYISNRNFKLAEISRSKDKLVDELRLLYEWFQKSLDEEPKHSPSFIESRLASLVVKLEFKANQLNNYVGSSIIKPETYIYKLRNFDISQLSCSEKNEETLRVMNEIVYDFIEHVEKSYDDYLMTSSNFFRKAWIYRKPEMLGGLCSLVLVYYFFSLAKILIFG